MPSFTISTSKGKIQEIEKNILKIPRQIPMEFKINLYTLKNSKA